MGAEVVVDDPNDLHVAAIWFVDSVYPGDGRGAVYLYPILTGLRI